MPEIRLHLDADTSRKSLYKALLERGHDVTRTPADWIAFDADDERQASPEFWLNAQKAVDLHRAAEALGTLPGSLLRAS